MTQIVSDGELPSTAHSLAEAALIYARAGFRVVPLHHTKGYDDSRRPICSCKRGAECGRDEDNDSTHTSAGKHPAILAWQNEASCDEKKVAEWWRKFPKANIGIAMGGPERIVAMDIDGPTGRESIAAIESVHGALPDTFTTRSGRDGGGEHRIFMVPDNLELPRNTAGRVGPGIDVRGVGGQVASCPSMHHSGRRYEIARGFPIAEIPIWLHAMMVDKPVAPAAPDVIAPVFQLDDRRKSAYFSKALATSCAEILAAPTGTRNDVLNAKAYSLARFVAGGEIDADTVWDALADAGRRAKLTPTEIEGTLASAFRAAQIKPKLMPPPKAMRGTGTDGPAPDPNAMSVVNPLARGDHVELAALTLEILETSPMTHDDGEFWRYDTASGVWLVLPTERVENTVASFAGAYVSTSKGKVKPLQITAGACVGTTRVVRNSLVSRPQRHSFSDARTGIAFRDRFVTIDDGEIRCMPHAPDNLARAGLPFDYDPLPHPQLDAFFAGVFDDCTETDRSERVALLQEFIGACLMGIAPTNQKCLMLFGTGNNGKSQLLTIARSCFPAGTVTSLPPQRWEERFGLTQLVGKLANFCDEMPQRDMLSSDVFKGVVTGEPQTTEYKGRDMFTLTPRAGHMFSANALPTTTDHSVGFYRRFIVLPLTRKFTDADRTLDIGARVAAAERQAIAAWAVEGARRLQSAGRYTEVTAANALRAQWIRESDNVLAFVDMACEPVQTAAAGMMSAELYRSYAQWAKASGFQPCNLTNFGKRLKVSGVKHDTDRDKRTRYAIRPLSYC